MKNVNFESIKSTLAETGMAHKEMAEAATQKVVFVTGEWNRDGSANIKETRAGWIVGDFPKCVNVSIEVPQTSNFKTETISDAVQAQFPDAKIIVRIQ